MDSPRFRIISEGVQASSQSVYEYVRSIANMPRWASGLGSGVNEVNGRWYADSPMGLVEVEMATRNGFGVLDHDVIAPDGSRTRNAFRVPPAGQGAVLRFTLLSSQTASADEFERDAATVAHDLQTIKKVLEGR